MQRDGNNVECCLSHQIIKDTGIESSSVPNRVKEGEIETNIRKASAAVKIRVLTSPSREKKHVYYSSIIKYSFISKRLCNMNI